LSGIWENGEFKEGFMIYPNGIYFEGKFVKNKPSGEGVWKFQNGNAVKGKFEQKEEDDPNGGDLKITKISWTTAPEILDINKLWNF
jgi:hypothetical protein